VLPRLIDALEAGELDVEALADGGGAAGANGGDSQ
jgi:hypothetical protein